MARSEARICVEIWEDPDFLGLTAGAQRLFVFLLSQADLAHTGVLALRERRWSRAAVGLTTEQVATDLSELERGKFVVIDYDVEELLIRSFIRRDKVFRQPNVLRAAADHLALVTSGVIRRALAVELDRIADEGGMSEGSAALIDEMRRALKDSSGNPSSNPSGNPSGMPRPMGSDMPTGDESAGREGSGNPSGMPTPGAPGDRGVVTAVTKDSPNPVPRSSNPKNTPPERSARASKPGTDDDPVFVEFWAAYPRREAKGEARKAWAKVTRNTDPAVIVAAAARYRDRPGREARFTAMPATWLNAERWNDEPEDPSARPPPNGNGYRGPYRNRTDPSAYHQEQL